MNAAIIGSRPQAISQFKVIQEFAPEEAQKIEAGLNGRSMESSALFSSDSIGNCEHPSGSTS
jgi:hypothetical protein